MFHALGRRSSELPTRRPWRRCGLSTPMRSPPKICAPLNPQAFVLRARMIGLLRGSPNRLPDARHRARFTAGHGALAGVTVQPPVSPTRALRHQIRKEWPRLEVPVGLSDRSTTDRRPGLPRQVRTGPRIRGAPHQSPAATRQPGQQPSQPAVKAMHILQKSPCSF